MSSVSTSPYSSASSTISALVSASAAGQPIPAALSMIASTHARAPTIREVFLSQYEEALKCLQAADPEKARQFLQKAVRHDPRTLKESGCGPQLQEARSIYGKMCLYGQGGPINEERGLICLRAASTNKHADAMCEWGIYLLQSNPKKGKGLLEIASSQNSPKAKVHLAYVLLKEDPVKSEELIEEARKLGHQAPEYALAALLVKAKRREDALPWIRKAAQQNNANAMYDDAQSIKASDPVSYGQQIELAASLGCAEAQFEMGMQYAGLLKKIWLDVNPERARAFLSKAAMQNHPGAFYELANLYLDIHEDMARKLYIQAIAAAAIYHDGPLFAAPFFPKQVYEALGTMIANGIGCDPDPILAFEFFRRS